MEDNMNRFLSRLGTRQNWSTEEVRGMMMTFEITGRRVGGTISTLQVGDVFMFNILGTHPALIFKVEDNIVWAAILSSTQSELHNIYQIKGDRFWEGSYVTNTIVCVKALDAITQYKSSLTNLKLLPGIINSLKIWNNRVLSNKKPKKWEPVDWEKQDFKNLEDFQYNQ